MRISDTKHTHRHIHIQVDFFKALFSEMSKTNSQNASSYIVANSASSFFFSPFSISTHCCFQPLSCPRPFPPLAPSKCFHFCFQSKGVASAIALLPRQHLLWRNCGQCSLTELHQARSCAHVCAPMGNTEAGHPALPLCSCPTDLSSHADREYLQTALGEQHSPHRYYGVGCSLTEITAQTAACFASDENETLR